MLRSVDKDCLQHFDNRFFLKRGFIDMVISVLQDTIQVPPERIPFKGIILIRWVGRVGRYSDQGPGALQFALKGFPATTLFATGPRKVAIAFITSAKSGETLVNRFLRVNPRHREVMKQFVKGSACFPRLVQQTLA